MMGISGLLLPSPTDKLRAHCKMFGHEWGIKHHIEVSFWVYDEVMETGYVDTNCYTYQLCLRCSDYIFYNEFERARNEARRRIAKAYGVAPADVGINHDGSRRQC